MFVGGYQHAPNIDAVQFFVTSVMPELRKLLPGVRFYAVGSKPPQEILDLACGDVVITGFVEHLLPLLDRMRVSVAPLRYGAGIKGKIGTAMAAGLPVVATTLAVEGMDLTDEQHVLVADDPVSIANTIARLYADGDLWQKLSVQGLEFAERTWGGRAAWSHLAGIVRELGMPVQMSRFPLTLHGAMAPRMPAKNLVDQIEPIAIVRSRKAYETAMNGQALAAIRATGEKLLAAHPGGQAFAVSATCVPCEKKVRLLVDMQSGGQLSGLNWLPNWRERLECPECHMNNRQRLMATLVGQVLRPVADRSMDVYFMEQVTPIYEWTTGHYPQHQILGSEYLGHQYRGGEVVRGIRHEDVTQLSFANESLDLIVSNDVFEHVPVPALAFSECARVLRAGGCMLATIPFHAQMDKSVVRARVVEGEVENILAPMFHGNPVSAEGSLVFTDFGWDLLDSMRSSGFGDVSVQIFLSESLGHLGNGEIVFKASKS
jgi:hypothetical protein